MKKQKMETKQAFEELHLNIKHQNIEVDEFTSVGYEIERGVIICTLIIPFKQLPFKPNKGYKKAKKGLDKLKKVNILK